MDDNTHPARTLRMADVSIEAGKEFDMLIVSIGFDGISNARYKCLPSLMIATA